MTSFLTFSVDTFKKRKEFQYLLATQISITFLAYYIIILTNAMLISLIKSDLMSLINTSIVNYYGAFFIIITIFGVIFSAGLILFIIRLVYFYQTKELAVMIGIGGLLEKIQNYFLVQLVYMCLIANFIGIFAGYLGVILTLFVTTLIFPELMSNTYLIIPDYQVLIVFIFIFFSSYLISARLIMNSSKRYQDSLINDEIDFNSATETAFLAKLFILKRKKNGFVDTITKLVRLNIMRKSFVFVVSLITTFIYIFFLITLVFGTMVISDSLNSSMYSATGGENTYMIVHKSHTKFFSESFNIYSPSGVVNNFNFDESSFEYGAIFDLINSNKPKDLFIDDRIIFYKEFIGTNVAEQAEDINTINPGSIKTSNGYLIGINNQIPKWKYYGENPKEFSKFSSTELMIGEKLVWNLFVDPFNGRFYVADKSTTKFSISTILVDPFLKGNAVYMNINTLISFYKLNGNNRNLVLINTANNEYIDDLRNNIVSINPNLEIISIKNVLDQNFNYNFLFSTILFTFSVPLIVTYIIVIYSYSQQLINERKKQMNILKALGSNKSDFKRVLMKEIFAYSFWGNILGTVTGMFFIHEIVVPFPVVTIQTLIITIIILALPWLIIYSYLSIRINSIYEEYCMD